MVPKTKAREDLEKFQSSLCKSVQRNLKIIQDFEDQGVCSQFEIQTGQCGVVHQDAVSSHHGARQTRNGDIILQNIGRAVDKNNRGDLNPSLYYHCEDSNGAIRERPSKNMDIVRPQPSTEIV